MPDIPPFASPPEPLQHLQRWLEEARQTEPEYPEAAALATMGGDGWPSVRMVLVRQLDARGCVFYTNLNSRKVQQLATNPRASLMFHWKSQRRQVRLEGVVEAVTAAEADAYFARRPRTSQLGAWASRQSDTLASRAALEAEVEDMAQKFEGRDVPRPDFWSGFRLLPQRMEFWQEKPFRLHDRRLYMRVEDGWQVSLLYP